VAGRKPAEAVDQFLDPIRKAVACIVKQPSLNRGHGDDPKQNPHSLVLNIGDPVRIQGSQLWFSLTQSYDVLEAEGERGQYKVSTNSYIYAIYDGPDEESEIISFHYHPQNNVDFCHMHLRQDERFGDVHFPTGRVAVEEVIALAIRDLGVKPRLKEYRSILTTGLDKFRQWRTWSLRG
jgi:hypothetical protein